jgi:hypothetical protein
MVSSMTEPAAVTAARRAARLRNTRDGATVRVATDRGPDYMQLIVSRLPFAPLPPRLRFEAGGGELVLTPVAEDDVTGKRVRRDNTRVNAPRDTPPLRPPAVCAYRWREDGALLVTLPPPLAGLGPADGLALLPLRRRAKAGPPPAPIAHRPEADRRVGVGVYQGAHATCHFLGLYRLPFDPMPARVRCVIDGGEAIVTPAPADAPGTQKVRGNRAGVGWPRDGDEMPAAPCDWRFDASGALRITLPPRLADVTPPGVPLALPAKRRLVAERKAREGKPVLRPQRPPTQVARCAPPLQSQPPALARADELAAIAAWVAAGKVKRLPANLLLCEHVLKKGKRCGRRPEPGSQFCTQHQRYGSFKVRRAATKAREFERQRLAAAGVGR